MIETERNLEKLTTKKILILYSIPEANVDDETWIGEETVGEGVAAIESLGLSVFVREVTDSVEKAVEGFSPNETLILNWCEGLDGNPNDYSTVPFELERLGFIYTGSGPEALLSNADKTNLKDALTHENLSTPKFFIYHGEPTSGWNLFPALVKPVGEHASCGITRESVVDNGEQMLSRAKELLEIFGKGILVEDFIDGPEYNLTIWGGDELEVLPIPEIDFARIKDYHDRLVVYDAKWHEESDGWAMTTVICPAPMAEEIKKAVTELGLAAYQAMECRDYARVDIRVRGEVPYVLDVNLNPDITKDGGLMRSAAVAGYSYGEMLVKILALATERMV